MTVVSPRRNGLRVDSSPLTVDSSQLSVVEQPALSAEPEASVTHRPEVVYLVRREGLSSVFVSQVVRRMQGVAEAGYDVSIVVLCPLGQFVKPALRERWDRVLAGLPESLDGRLQRLVTPPSRIEWPWAERTVLRHWLRQHGGDGRQLIVHCRNATVTHLALDLKRKLPELRVLYDSRGIEDEEHLYPRYQAGTMPDRRATQETQRLLTRQRRAAREAESVVCVSEAMVEYLAERHGIDREKCEVVPCCVDVRRFENAADAREQLREERGLADRFVVCYCGSIKAWQMPKESLGVFRRLQQWEPDPHFLAVTTQPDAMQSQIATAAIPPERVTVVSLPPDDVPQYLAAADCGLLLRENSPVNRVASPVKFGEYLAAGTPVIMSDGIGDYSDLARRERVGLVLPSDASEAEVDARLKEFLDDYRADPQAWQARCRRVAREQLDSGVHLPKVLALYERLARGE